MFFGLAWHYSFPKNGMPASEPGQVPAFKPLSRAVQGLGKVSEARGGQLQLPLRPDQGVPLPTSGDSLGGGGRSSAGPRVPERQLSSEAEHEGNKRGRRGHEMAAGREARAKSLGPAQPHQAAAHLGLQVQILSGCDRWDTRAR